MQINELEDAQSEKIIELLIPFEILDMNLKNSENKLCYNIILHENAFDDIWETIAQAYIEQYKVGAFKIPECV